MSEPDRAHKTSSIEFKTEYARRLKDSRLDYQKLSKFARISSPQNIRKAKVEIHPVKNVSRYSIPLTGINPGVNHPIQVELLTKICKERPSNDYEDLAANESKVVTIQVNPPLGNKQDIVNILTEDDSDDLEFNDSSDTNMDSQDDSNNTNSTDNSTN